MQPVDLVLEFCNAWPDCDPAKLAPYFADNAVYHNMPVDPVVGRDNIQATIAGFMTGVDRIEFEILHLAVSGDVVMTERVDRFFTAAGTIALPVMGTFEVRDDKIQAWRDYFDLNQFMSQLSATTA